MKQLIRKILNESESPKRMYQWADNVRKKGVDEDIIKFIVDKFPTYKDKLQNKDLLSYSTPEKVINLFNLLKSINESEPYYRFKKFADELLNSEFDIDFHIHQEEEYPEYVSQEDKNIFGDHMLSPTDKILHRKLKPSLIQIYVRSGFFTPKVKKSELKRKGFTIEGLVIFENIDFGDSGITSIVENVMDISHKIKSMAQKYGFKLIIRIKSTDDDVDEVMSTKGAWYDTTFTITKSGRKYGNKDIVNYIDDI